MSSLKNVVLIGGSGNLGKLVLKALQADSSFNITVITRDSSMATFPEGIKVARVPDEYPEDVMKDVFTGQDAVICAVGHTAAGHQKMLIDVAAAARVKRFIPTEFGSNSRSAKAIEVFPMLAPKAQANEYLKTKEAEGLTWTAIATGPWFDFCLTTGFLGFDLQTHKATIYDSGDVAFSTSTRAFTADAIVAVLKHPAQTANKLVYVSSFETTANKVLASLEKTTGQKFEIERVKSDEMIVQGREELKAGNMYGGMAKLLLSCTHKGGLGNDFAKEESLANDMLGLPQEDLDAVLERVLRTGE